MKDVCDDDSPDVADDGSQCLVVKSKSRTSLSTQRSSGLSDCGLMAIPPKMMRKFFPTNAISTH